MQYTDYAYFLMFLPALLIIYQILKPNFRYISLLIFSLIFLALFGVRQLPCVFIAAAVIYIVTNIMEKQKNPSKSKLKKRKRALLAAGVILLLGILVAFKYFNFFADLINQLVGRSSEGSGGIPMLNLIAPIGISFYTMQAIGYMADVYWGKVKAERSYLKLLLFLSFFPTVMEGPIASYTDVKESLFGGADIKSENLVDGGMRIVWGLFKKIVVADRLYVIVSTLFDSGEISGGAYVVIAAVAYTIQLYMEFSGCMDIVIGSGKLFGIKLPENFRQPFLSKNASEFWRRWHISLGVWFKTYIFYPVSMSGIAKKWNQFGRQKLNKYITMLVTSAMALFPVWLCNGLWHGPKVTYIFYGMYYFVIIMLELALEPVGSGIKRLLKIKDNSRILNFVLIIKTWIIIFVGELFFRANTIGQGFDMLSAMFKGFSLRTFFDGSVYGLGLSKPDFLAAFFGAMIVFIVGLMREKNENLLASLRGRKIYVRWTVYILLILSVIIFGAYGIGYSEVDFIYAGF